MNSNEMEEIIEKQLDKTLKETNFTELGELYRGKVRDNYIKNDIRIQIATDRISAFDRVITTIPFKGQLLNQTSAFWFEKTKNLVKNHIIDVPDPNVVIVHQCQLIPIEIIVRAYLTGTAWRNYVKGKPTSGVTFPKGMKKNQKLNEILITPSTKADSGHDINISFEEMINMIGREDAEKLKESSLKIYNEGSEYARKRGIIIADTKFEFGKIDDQIIVVDEVLTPDSSRFWPADLYEPGKSQPSFDKQYVRDYLSSTGWDKNSDPPHLPDNVINETQRKYQEAYEKITGQKFQY